MFLSSLSFALSENEIFGIAQTEFNKTVPIELRNEFSDLDIKISNPDPSYYQNVYHFTWRRVLNGIRFGDDRFSIGVYEDGTTTSSFYQYSASSSQIDITPSITSHQARFVVDRNIDSISEDKGLEIQGGKLYYIFVVKGGNWVRVDAKTGYAETYQWALGSDGSGGTAQFDATQYYSKVYGPYLVLGLIGIGGLVYWKRRSLFGTRKR